MAGEWLKFEANTPEKPEVFSITVAMGWDDPDLTVGKLLKVWRWFDQQTIDGNAPRVTLSLLDRISGVSGFAQAMCDVGWLVCSEIGISLPNFDRHNGKTAKDRCLTAKRVAKHKSNAGGNGVSVTAPLPREEKRREEKEEDQKQDSAAALAGAGDGQEGGEGAPPAEPPAPAKPADPVAFTLPTNTGDEFPIIVQRVAEFKLLYPAVNVDQELKNMRGWLLSNPTRRKTKSGMMKFVNTWLSKQQNSAPQGRLRPSSNDFEAPGDDADDPFNTLRRA